MLAMESGQNISIDEMHTYPSKRMENIAIYSPNQIADKEKEFMRKKLEEDL